MSQPQWDPPNLLESESFDLPSGVRVHAIMLPPELQGIAELLHRSGGTEADKLDDFSELPDPDASEVHMVRLFDPETLVDGSVPEQIGITITLFGEPAAKLDALADEFRVTFPGPVTVEPNPDMPWIEVKGSWEDVNAATLVRKMAKVI